MEHTRSTLPRAELSEQVIMSVGGWGRSGDGNCNDTVINAPIDVSHGTHVCVCMQGILIMQY